jgi:thioredoxin 1
MLKLIDFWAEWCPPCKVMSPIVDGVLAEFKEEIELEKVDVDKDSARASECEVFSIPTFVLEEDGKEIDRTTGARSKEEFKKWIEQHLKS